MNFLVDTSVISHLAPGRSAIAPERMAWALANQHRWFLPTVTAMEMKQGICKLERAGATRRAADLDRWFGTMLVVFRERIVEFDLASAIVAAGLSDRTCNLRHFEPMGVPAFDPFSADPAKRPT